MALRLELSVNMLSLPRGTPAATVSSGAGRYGAAIEKLPSPSVPGSETGDPPLPPLPPLPAAPAPPGRRPGGGAPARASGAPTAPPPRATPPAPATPPPPAPASPVVPADLGAPPAPALGPPPPAPPWSPCGVAGCDVQA